MSKCGKMLGDDKTRPAQISISTTRAPLPDQAAWFVRLTREEFIQSSYLVVLHSM
jgi:hypothetical protein